MKESKKIFILRHGIAVEPGAPGYSDSQRPLTPRGISEMHLIAKGMKKLGLEFDLVLSSPYVRARQTAEIIAEELGIQKKLKFSETLASGADPRSVLKELKEKYSEMGSLLLVGHEPFLSGLISLMITGNKNASLEFKKGGLCKLSDCSFDSSGLAVLKWLLTPKQLMLLADPAH